MFCKYCENEISLDDVICPTCGKQVKPIKINEESVDIDTDGDKANISIKDFGKSVLCYLLKINE